MSALVPNGGTMPPENSNDPAITGGGADTMSAQRRPTQQLCASCDRCRARKTKCDGGRPCSNCVTRYRKVNKCNRCVFPFSVVPAGGRWRCLPLAVSYLSRFLGWFMLIVKILLKRGVSVMEEGNASLTSVEDVAIREILYICLFKRRCCPISFGQPL